MRISKVVPITLLIFIPLSWIINILYSNHIIGLILYKSLDSTQVNNIMTLMATIPLSSVINMATVIIPAIMVRKAVREGTRNLSNKDNVADE